MSLFSVVIPWRNRPEIARSLEANAELFIKHEVDIVIANCGGDAEMLRRLTSAPGLPTIRHLTIQDTMFNRSLSNNLGASLASGSWLFFLDADIILQSDVFEETREMLAAGDCVIKIRRVREAQPTIVPKLAFLKELNNTREVICTDGRRAVLHAFMSGDGSKCGPGLLLMNKAHFLDVGGFNSALKGWGYEDLDLTMRLQFVLGLTPRAAGQVLHLTHGDDVRSFLGATPWEDNSRNQSTCTDNYNQGQFMGTYFDDVAAWRATMEETVNVCQHQS